MVFKPGWKKKALEAKIAAETKVEITPAVSVSPIVKAFYIEKEKGVWRLVIADIQDDKVIKKQVKECENKAISLEAFKMAFARLYYFGK